MVTVDYAGGKNICYEVSVENRGFEESDKDPENS